MESRGAVWVWEFVPLPWPGSVVLGFMGLAPRVQGFGFRVLGLRRWLFRGLGSRASDVGFTLSGVRSGFG